MLKKTAIALLFSVLSLSADSTLARAACFGWIEARPIITQEGLLRLRDIRQNIQNRFDGELIRAKLCERKGQFVYDVKVLGPRGQVSSVTVNGRTGERMRAMEASGRQVIIPSSAAAMPKFDRKKLPKFKRKKGW